MLHNQFLALLFVLKDAEIYSVNYRLFHFLKESLSDHVKKIDNNVFFF